MGLEYQTKYTGWLSMVYSWMGKSEPETMGCFLSWTISCSFPQRSTECCARPTDEFKKNGANMGSGSIRIIH